MFMANLFPAKRMLFALGFFLCMAANPALAADPDLAKAEALMREGKAAEAYTLLEPFEFEQSGNIKFDYLLGIAALDSGKPDKATLAFERVLAADPNFAGARIDMARAYFQLGDMTRAKTEFEAVLTQNPPPAARVTIDKYMAAIAQQESASQTRSSGYVEFSVGHDSNVNFATSARELAVPALGNLVFALSPNNVKLADNYLGVGLGGEISHQISPKFGVYAGADVRVRDNRTQNTFDSTALDGRVGVALGEAADVLRLGVQGGKFDLDGKNNRNTDGVSAEWRHLLDPANQLSLFLLQARYRFEPSISVNNFDQTTLGTNWLTIFNDGKGMFSGTLITGNDRIPTTEDGTPVRADGGKRFNGIRLGAQVQLDERLDLFAGIGAQWSKYDTPNVTFSSPTESVTRDDRLYDANIGLNWRLDKNWSLRPQIAYLRNNSNIVIYQHDRTDIAVTLRRDFR
jgi:tetratricopeptide (TPR) repeat protein